LGWPQRGPLQVFSFYRGNIWSLDGVGYTSPHKQALDFYKPLKILCHTLKYEILSKLLVPIGQLTFLAKKFSQHFFSMFLRSCGLAHSTPYTLRQEKYPFFISKFSVIFIFFSVPNAALFSFLYRLQMPRYFHFFLYSKFRVIFIPISVPNAALFSFLFLIQTPRFFRFFFCSKCRVIFISFWLQIPRYFHFFSVTNPAFF
jgi:hypothetical protein